MEFFAYFSIVYTISVFRSNRSAGQISSFILSFDPVIADLPGHSKLIRQRTVQLAPECLPELYKAMAIGS
jgi:hypothetical protein